MCCFKIVLRKCHKWKLVLEAKTKKEKHEDVGSSSYKTCNDHCSVFCMTLWYKQQHCLHGTCSNECDVKWGAVIKHIHAVTALTILMELTIECKNSVLIHLFSDNNQHHDKTERCMETTILMAAPTTPLGKGQMHRTSFTSFRWCQSFNFDHLVGNM